MKGQTLSHYRVLEMIGQGASGVIYKAEDLSLGRPVALKCLPPDVPGSGSAVVRFQHEARTASGINHPNICTIHEIGEHDGQQFIVMEWLDGRTLAELIDGRPLKLENLLEYAIQVADGLHAAHAEGVVHRDVKPANIFVTHTGQVKILDFGIATLTSPSVQPTQSHSPRVGTAPYMSPEQVHGDDLDHRSDIFSLGVVLYEMATARRPFVAGTIPEITRLIADHSPDPLRALNPALPEELDRIVTKALEKNRKMRFQTAADLKVDLQRLLRDFSSGVLRTTPKLAQISEPRTPHAVHRFPLRKAAIVAIGSSLVVAGILFANRRFFEDDTEEMVPIPIDVSRGRLTDIALGAAIEPKPAVAPPKPTVPRAPMPSRAPAPPTAAVTALPSPSSEPLVTTEPQIATDAEELNRELDIVRTKAEAGLNEQALQALRPLLARYRAEPEVASAYFLMADIQETQRAYEDAMATYLETAERFPDEHHGAQALYRFANAALKSKQSNKEVKARETLGELARRYPQSEWAPQGLLLKAAIEERKRLYKMDAVLGISVPAALITYRHLTESYPTVSGSATAHKKLAQLYEDVRRYHLAARALENLATRHPDVAGDAWYRAAELYRRVKDEKAARDAYAKVPRGSRRYNDAQSRLR